MLKKQSKYDFVCKGPQLANKHKGNKKLVSKTSNKIKGVEMRLKDKVAIVTGGASGIGRAIVESYAAEGAIVAIADLNFEAAQAVANELLAKDAQAIPVAMNVADEASVDNGIAEIYKKYGRIDILVSNAGVQHISPINELALADWKKMLAIHLDGAFLTTRACLKAMYKEGKGGCIIYIGSVHCKQASLLKAPYVTAKHGLIGLCKVVAKEGAEYGVRANVICPGFVRTPLVDKQIPEQAKTLGISEEAVIKSIMLKETVDGEFTSAMDVAEAAVFFAAFPSNALTGQSLIVSHGWFMQ